MPRHLSLSLVIFIFILLERTISTADGLEFREQCCSTDLSNLIFRKSLKINKSSPEDGGFNDHLVNGSLYFAFGGLILDPEMLQSTP